MPFRSVSHSRKRRAWDKMTLDQGIEGSNPSSPANYTDTAHAERLERGRRATNGLTGHRTVWGLRVVIAPSQALHDTSGMLRLARGIVLVVLLGSIAACSGPGSLARDTGEPAAATPSLTIGPMGVALPRPWATATLIDVRSGEPFRIADLVAAGKVVFLEPMAVWCSKCRAQQERAVDAMARLDRSKVVWIGLDIETAESAEQLAAYSEAAGFDFTYAIADRDVSRALVDDFGDVVLNPPATNVIVIDPGGQEGASLAGNDSSDASRTGSPSGRDGHTARNRRRW
jgi:hypothetical protein